MHLPRLRLHSGDTFDPGFALKAVDGITPVDLTGWTLTATLRTVARAEIAESVVTILDAPGGIGQITIDAADTEDIPSGVYVMNVRRTMGATVRSSAIFEVEVIVPPTMAAP